MIANRNVGLDNLITIDSTGVNVASFVEIRSALIEKYKDIYGQDIDLSTGNADGEFVNELALIMNNTFQSIRSLYSNLDVNTASGVYLDALCALSNVHRKQATKSFTTVQLTNNSNSQVAIDAIDVAITDQSGMQWNSDQSIDLAPQGQVSIVVRCSEYGPVKAPAGWLTILVGYPDVDVLQSDPATVGEEEESDQSLRSRRNQFISPIGMTVLQSLSAALLDIQAIKDVKIYNNPNSSDQATPDGTDVLAHGIYVIIRQTSNTINVDELIANTIYEKLTPGIKTTETADITNGIDKSKVYEPTLIGQTISGVNETVYWKLAEPINPTITIKYTEVANSGYSTNTRELVGNAIMNYINELAIGKIPDINEVIMEMLTTDPRSKGISTISIAYSDIATGIAPALTNNDTYYNYTTIGNETGSGSVHIFTLN